MAGPTRAEDVRPESVSWLWRERIPRGMISIIAGRPDQGKGLVSTLIAAEVSQTRLVDVQTGETRFGNVLYSAIEDSHGLMTRPRLEAAGANLDTVHLWRFQIPAQLAELEAIVIDKSIDLVVIDPFAAHLSNGVSRHSDNIRNVLNPLSELLEATGAAMVIVEHVLKRVPQTGHPLQAIGGSGSGVVAASRMAFLLGIDPADEDRRVLAAVKHNICEKPRALAFDIDTETIEEVGDVPMLVFDSEVDFDAMRLVQTSQPGKVGRPPDKRAAAAEWLTNYLHASGPIMAGKVIEDAKQYGMTTKTLRRAANDMGIVRTPPGGGRNCTWELPDEILALLDPDHVPASGNVDTPDDDVAELSDQDIAQLLGGPDGD